MPRPLETNAMQRTQASTARAPALRNAGVQPAVCRTAANGMADTIWPNWPRLPIHWLSCGTRGAQAPHPLVWRGDPGAGEPRARQPQDRREHGRVAGTDEDPSEDGKLEG